MPYRTDLARLAGLAVQAIAAERVRAGHAPACSWAILTPAGVVASGAQHDGTTGRAPSTTTGFRVASCTKSLTAATLLALEEDGRLALEAPLDDLLPATVLGASRAPTLAELASMTGGIPIDDPWADRQEAMPAADLDALLADGIRLAHEPGTRYEYSSTAYAILGRVIERVTGRPYPEVVRERLLDPLGLDVLRYERGDDDADGYARVDGAWALQPWTGPGAFSALGGLIASPSALAGWAGWLASAWRDEGGTTLSTEARRRMQSPHAQVPGPAGNAYGYGLVVEEDARHGRVVSHSGGYPGFGAHMRWHAASGLGVVVTENARYSGATVPATQALTLLLESAREPEADLVLWPQTRAARIVVEALLRRWDHDALAAIAADNLALDESFAARAGRAADLRDRIELDPAAPIGEPTAVRSDSPAHLAWTVPGATGAVRCEIRMTPLREPRLQTLALRLT